MNKSPSAVKVLVVDDEPLIVEELCEFLENSGYSCIPCESGQQAIELFCQDTDIGLVLCDLRMPDLDGIELVHALQRVAGKPRSRPCSTSFHPVSWTSRAWSARARPTIRSPVSWASPRTR